MWFMVVPPYSSTNRVRRAGTVNLQSQPIIENLPIDVGTWGEEPYFRF